MLSRQPPHNPEVTMIEACTSLTDSENPDGRPTTHISQTSTTEWDSSA